MKQRGRPLQNGVQPNWMAFRTLSILEAYQQSRKTGTKHSSAVREAAETVHNALQVNVSETEVKRIIAEWQPACGEYALTVTKMSDSSMHEKLHELRSLEWPECLNYVKSRFHIPDVPDFKSGFTLSLEERPKHPRHNVAISRSQKEKTEL